MSAARRARRPDRRVRAYSVTPVTIRAGGATERGPPLFRIRPHGRVALAAATVTVLAAPGGAAAQPPPWGQDPAVEQRAQALLSR